MKQLLILFSLVTYACGNPEKADTRVLNAVRTQIAEGNKSAALTLLLEAEDASSETRLEGEIACEIGRLYRQQGRCDLAHAYFVKAFSRGFLDLDAFAEERRYLPARQTPS